MIINNRYSATLLAAGLMVLGATGLAMAAGTAPDPIDVTSKEFQITVCGGPAELNTWAAHQVPNGKGGTMNDPSWPGPSDKFVACDFSGVMLQVQRVINIMIVAGVLLSIVGIVYAGFLYISGKEANINKAKEIGPRLAGGFAIMLVAWFIVSQILNWLTENPSFRALIGS